MKKFKLTKFVETDESLPVESNIGINEVDERFKEECFQLKIEILESLMDHSQGKPIYTFGEQFKYTCAIGFSTEAPPETSAKNVIVTAKTDGTIDVNYCFYSKKTLPTNHAIQNILPSQFNSAIKQISKSGLSPAKLEKELSDMAEYLISPELPIKNSYKTYYL